MRHKDTLRLDWLDRDDIILEFGENWVAIDSAEGRIGGGKTIREAIDSAMDGTLRIVPKRAVR